MEINIISKEKLKAWCIPILNNKAYYRPFICEGDLSKADIFLVGINPATLIYSEEMDVNTQLLDYNRFIGFYKKSRLEKGKDEISMIGQKSYIDYLKGYTCLSIL